MPGEHTENAGSDEGSKRQRSVWRETSTILDAVKQALIKGVHMLGTYMRNWDVIAQKLAEPPRKRIPQIPRLNEAPAPLR